jgi:hypothetical protein
MCAERFATTALNVLETSETLFVSKLPISRKDPGGAQEIRKSSSAGGRLKAPPPPANLDTVFYPRR